MSQSKFDRFVERHPHSHQFFFQRPHVSRRGFFSLAGSVLSGSFLASAAEPAVRVDKLDVQTINRAENVIFILLTGAPSHTDTFDFKNVAGVTPAATLHKPEKINGIDFPVGLMPKIAQTALGDMAIIRSMRSWNLAHNLAQNWFQVGRNPVAALGDIAPNIGSIVAIEKESTRKATDVFPSFLALNSQGGVGAGYLASTYAPFKVTPAATGLRNVTNADGQARLNERMTMLESIDAPLRGSAYGREVAGYDAFYQAAKGLVYNPTVDTAFRLSQADRTRYGVNGFGDACLTAKQVLEANSGTRFIQISFGSWDHHNNIYSDPNTLQRMTRLLDDGVSSLMADLKASGLLSKTLIVMGGEFGRTVGRLSAQQGRDHYLQQFCVLAGAGIKGGRALGSTNSDGGRTDEFGWSRERDIRPEDIEATIYSALGINWTSIRYDDPFGRGFEYVPYAHEDLYAPVNELWA